MTHLGPSLRRAKVRERPRRRLLAAALVSILANSLAFLLLARAGAFQLGPMKSARVALAPVSASQWSANRAIHPDGAVPPKPAEPFAMPKPPVREPPDAARPEGQVVDVAPSPDSTRPKDARFLAERDGSVEQETRSRHARTGYERPLPMPQLPGTQTAPPPGEDGKSARAIPGAEGPVAAAPAASGAPKVALAPEAGGELGAGRAAGEESVPAPVPGVGEGGQRKVGAPFGNLQLVTPGTLARVAGGPSPDHLDGLEEGEGTFLNTRGWKYATFFNRIKQAVAASWDPLSPLDARDPDRSMFGYKDRFTLLGVTLDDSGHVKNLVVEQTSGADFLDRAAVAAFRSAQPFVNPPHGIVDTNGEIKFSFGFFLEVGRPGLRIYRAPMQ